MALKPSGRPVNPPMPNIGRNASANSIGGLNRIEPPQSEMSRHVKMITDGMEMSIVVAWKNAEIFVPMPVKYMWCAQTMNETNPMASTDRKSTRLNSSH